MVTITRVSPTIHLGPNPEAPPASRPQVITKVEKPGMLSTVAKAVTGEPLREALGFGVDQFLNPEKTIGQKAEEFSQREGDKTSPLVPGAPVRNSAVNVERNKLLAGGDVEQSPGIIKRVQEAVVADPNLAKRQDSTERAVRGAKADTENSDIGVAGSLKQGAFATGRAVGAGINTALGEEQLVLNARAQQAQAPKAKELQNVLDDIQARSALLGEEQDISLGDAIKTVSSSFASNPLGATQLVAEQLPNSLVSLATGLVGLAAAGPVGGIAGLLGGNVTLETGFKALEGTANERFLQADQKEVVKKGAIKGSVITGVDLATIGISNFILGAGRRAVEQATRKTLANAGVNVLDRNAVQTALESPTIAANIRLAQSIALAATNRVAARISRGTATTLIEATGEGLGDYLGELAAEGEASKIDAVVEALSSVGSSAITAGAIAVHNKIQLGKEIGKQKDLERFKEELAQDQVQQKGEQEQAAAGVVDINSPSSDPIIKEPFVPLTPEEIDASLRQEKLFASEVADVPVDVDALADVQGLDEAMMDPLFRLPEDLEQEITTLMQKDLDAGVSQAVARRRALEQLPDPTPFSQRRIAWSSTPSQTGMNLTQTKVPIGGVVVVGGGRDDHFSPAYTQALGETVQQWTKKFLPPEAKLVINLSGLTGTAVGAYQQGPNGLHIISPRELPRTATFAERQTPEGVTLDVLNQGEKTFNIFTQQQTFNAVTHEFGHAVVMANFAQRMPADLVNVIGMLDSGEVLSGERIASMPVEEGAVVRDFQDRKARVLDGSMTAQELTDNWLGVWKLGKDLLKKQSRSLESFSKAALLREGKFKNDASLSSRTLEQISALELVHAMGRDRSLSIADSDKAAEEYYLQFNEYMAEQFSRFANDRQIEKGTALGLFFRRALESLRAFFKQMKTARGEDGSTVIKPGETFANWVDQIHNPKIIRQARNKEALQKSIEIIERLRTQQPRVFRPSVNFSEKAQKAKTAAKRVVEAQMSDIVRRIQETRAVEKKKRETAKKVVQTVKTAEAKAEESEALDTLESLSETPEQKEALRERIRKTFPDPGDKDRYELMALVRTGQSLEAEMQLADILEERAAKGKPVITQGSQKPKDTFLDKGSEESEVVGEALNKIGLQNEAGIWKRAVNFVKDARISVLQLQQLSATDDDVGLSIFVGYQSQMLALKNNMLKQGTEVAQIWEDLSPAEAKVLDKVLKEEFYSGKHLVELQQDPGTAKWRFVMTELGAERLKVAGIDIATAQGKALGELYVQIKNSLLQHVQITEAVSVEIVRDKFAKAPLVMQRKVAEMRELAQKWREAPFLPQKHFGDFVVKVFEVRDGEKKMVFRTHFTNAADQDAAVAKLQAAVRGKGQTIEWGKIDTTAQLQLTLPKEFLSVLGDTGNFTGAQLEAIGDAMLPLRGDKAFSKFARGAETIAGGSPDTLRNYADWIESSSNFISKLAFSRKMSKARALTRASIKELQAKGRIDLARTKIRIHESMTRTQDFIMHPLEEWFQARSMIALTYLMWGPKTALVNLTGLFQTWAAVTADFGELKGNALMLGATKDLITGNLSPDEQWMENKALEDGIVDQGFGYFMSGLANAGTLARRVRPTMLGKAARMFVDVGMYPFKAVEVANRRLTLLAVYRGERDRALKGGNTIDGAMRSSAEIAGRYTKLLQNDYASGNRPEVLRGKKSILMIFLSYPQSILWIMSGAFERGMAKDARAAGRIPRNALGGMTMRMWIIFAALAGTEGVPFGKMIVDLIQKLWEQVGETDNVRLEGQRMLKETVGIESSYWRNVIQRGFLHDVLGVDLSGSLSLGTPLPGTGLFDSQAQTWQAFVGEAFSELSGPFGGVAKAPLALGFEDDVGLREVGKNLPGAAGAVARAAEATIRGVKGNQGQRILKDDEGNFRDPTKLEIAALASGFRLSEVAEFQNLEFAKRERVNYWNGRRTGLLRQFLKAVEDQDVKAREITLQDIDKFNAEVPHRQLRLSGKDRRMFVRNNKKAVRRLEQDKFPQRTRALQRDVVDVLR